MPVLWAIRRHCIPLIYWPHFKCFGCHGFGPVRNAEFEAIAAWNQRSESTTEQAARKVTEVRAKLHRGECVGEELTEALDALCEAVEAA